MPPHEYDSFVADNRPPLYWFVYGRIHDHDATEDIVQDAFVEVFLRWENFPAVGPARVYLYKTAITGCADHGRSQGRQPESLDGMRAGSEGGESVREVVDESVPDPALDFFARLEAQELAQALSEALHQLRAEYKEVLFCPALS